MLVVLADLLFAITVFGISGFTLVGLNLTEALNVALVGDRLSFGLSSGEASPFDYCIILEVLSRPCLNDRRAVNRCRILFKKPVGALSAQQDQDE